VDDVAIADLVSSFRSPSVQLTPLHRMDIPSVRIASETEPSAIRDHFHFRCKSGSADETVAIMKHIHSVKLSTPRR
jgi:hypothetical protein